MKRALRIMIALCLVFSSCGGSGDGRDDLRRVRYEKIQASNGMRLRTFAGQAQSGMKSKLSFRVNGTINELNVKIGDLIRKGEVIAKLDPTDYSLKVQEAEASLLQSRAQMRNAAASYSRIRDLYESHSASRNQLDASRAESESAAAAVEAMQKKLALTRSQHGYTVLKAPVDGTIAEVLIEKNETISRGEPVVVLNSDQNLEVRVSVPEILVAEVKKGNQVTVTFDALPGRFFIGNVSEVGVTSEAGTTFSVIIELDGTPSDVRPGMSAQAQFMFYDPEKLDRIFVPPIAVIGRGGENYVYLVEPQEDEIGVVTKRKVRVGSLTNEGLEILGGVKSGDYIVTAGWTKVHEGQRVRMAK